MNEDLSMVFKALGHPRRLKIVRRLMDRIHACCEVNQQENCCLEEPTCDFSELTEELGIQKATLSLDLKELRHAGIVQTIKDGRKVAIQINPELLEKLHTFFEVSIDQNTRNRMSELVNE
ncbi:MAG: winged helix-turn-helix transcriptional regulator [Gracilimonas sp.]|uniref:ArsR/SmtB family transcription factor n=1 Tax=Gracilimonas sp. TaxID=1974203 RepID=UPI00199A10BD|nr:ArsR family transcriptional regulator [Gracilimonas sp.]MBD3617698.1 winged helix-turn-helix transcriptional regulator [Gracilimonas sp.]